MMKSKSAIGRPAHHLPSQDHHMGINFVGRYQNQPLPHWLDVGRWAVSDVKNVLPFNRTTPISNEQYFKA